MRTILRWLAAVVVLVGGLSLGTGTASAATTPNGATVHAQNYASPSGGGLHPNDWWW